MQNQALNYYHGAVWFLKIHSCYWEMASGNFLKNIETLKQTVHGFHRYLENVSTLYCDETLGYNS